MKTKKEMAETDTKIKRMEELLDKAFDVWTVVEKQKFATVEELKTAMTNRMQNWSLILRN